MTIKNAAPARSMNNGEFSPDALGRIDIKQYYSAHKRLKGFEPLPQGGYQLMGGTRHKLKARAPLAALALTSVANFTAPLAIGTHTVWSASVGGTVAAVNIQNMAAAGGPVTFAVEAFSGAAWVQIGAAFGPWLTAADRTAALPPQEGVAATALRIRATVTVANTSVTLGAVTAWSEAGTPLAPRHVALTTDDGTAYVGFVTARIADFVTDAAYAGAAMLPLTDAAMLPDLSDYTEADTIALFHPSSVPTQRIRNFGAGHEWGVDAWPYDPVAVLDLGGTYAKTDDVWDIMIAWEGAVEIFLTLTIDGEQTPSIPLKDSVTNAVITADLSDAADWTAMAAALQTALQALPALGSGVTVAQMDVAGTGTRKFVITFGGDYAGAEYQVSGDVVNTVKASANAVHVQIGKTDGEPLFSALRGYPGLGADVQSRMLHGRIPAVSAAVLMSKAGEPFDFNIDGQNDNSARLDRIRARTNETVLAATEGKYLLVFTDRAAYFVTNRTIEKNTPLNFVRTADTGIRANSRAVDLDGSVYYISANGEQHISLAYDDVSTSFVANTESLLSNHLASQMKNQVRQRAESDQDAAAVWITRTDGRLVKSQVIRNQEITGYCEWLASLNGFVHEVSVDGLNRLWMTITRGGAMTHELYDRTAFLQQTVTRTCDLSGNVTGLAAFTGPVWAHASGHVLGPFTVASGSINLGDFFDGDIEIGTWIAPVAETMPMPFVTGNDDIVLRPGRIHTAHLNLIGTTSLAVAANGGTLENVPLMDTFDPVNEALPRKTMLRSIYGLLGLTVGPTLTVSQLRPGWLRVRDLALEAKL